jgi:small conductance mechanosensitive channel
LLKTRADRARERMFETRSDAWAAVGLEMETNERHMRLARRRLMVVVPLLVLCIIGEGVALHHIDVLHRQHPPMQWIVSKSTVRIVAVVVVIFLGWLISRDLGRLAPAIFKRMDPAAAGTAEFAIRFVCVVATFLGALAVGGISLQALAVGGAFTAVVLGLAAQQTLGNVMAGLVLLTARPFRLGERVRLQAGVVGGVTEGIVSSLGLLYTTLARGEDRILIPNNLVLSSVVVPVKEPAPVDVRVTLGARVRVREVQNLLDANVTTTTRDPPAVLLDEIQGENVIVRVRATPERGEDGSRLADEIIAVLAGVTQEHELPVDGQATEAPTIAGRGPETG